jgi:head-tail adaptor
MTYRTVRAGPKQRYITITDSRTVPDSSGQPLSGKPRLVCEAYAEVLSVAGGEKVRGLMIEAEATDLLKITYRDGLKPTMTVHLGSRTLNILSARDPDGRQVELFVTCKEDTALN